MSWLRFLCLSLWQDWRHLLGADVAYGQIYIRARFRCSSPVCSQRDFTPHHLQFRSAGASDDEDNVATICSWCHLDGVQGGRIRALGTAPFGATFLRAATMRRFARAARGANNKRRRM